MVPITHLVNTPHSHPIRSDLFEGELVAQIQGMTDEQGKVHESEYFKREDRGGVTWSIVVRADDILFGNTFDRPLKLPWGTSAVLKFMHYIDPTLKHDLTSSTKPWALSPLISTMPHFMHTRIPPSSSSCMLPPFSANQSIQDRNSGLYLALSDELDEGDSASSSSGTSFRSASSSSDNVAPVSPSPLSTARSSSKGSSTGGSSFSVKSAMRKVKPKHARSTLSTGSSSSSEQGERRMKRERKLQTL
ncbi:UPF0590 protein [Psilocybe cubensis]|uniref:UPF0590 protein n=1 Tax=Psilocybe cubensis TaxID=181762 RepID=A0ACB8GLH6_PSICU|nr:UPF0590 protein [Psilocybe cubensis]KAH9476066.1 UPF0590 protein [Psilocybe cubensis]